MSLSLLILLALVLGIGSGELLYLAGPDWVGPINDKGLVPIGQVFLRLIQFVVVPIVFSSLILGLNRIQNAAQVGRYTAKLLLTYLATSIIAVGLGLAIAALLQPGLGLDTSNLPAPAAVAPAPDLLDWLVQLIPTNPLQALSSGNLLQTIVAAALIGIGMQRAGAAAAPFLAVVQSVYAISEQILTLILNLAPIGVFALISSVIAVQGLDILNRLLVYMAGVVLAIGLMIGVYGLLLLLVRGRPLHFFRSFAPALSLAFGTASSNAALPIALQNAQEDYGLAPDIASFAIPLGTALKRDGMAIGQSFNSIFVAQLYHIPITPSLLSAIALSTILVSFSTAGVPGAGIVMMTTVLTAAGLPLEGIAIVAGIDRLMDGFHTILNVIGNTASAVVLAQWEGQREGSTPQIPVPAAASTVTPQPAPAEPRS
jgi:proton glutamate symport protein